MKRMFASAALAFALAGCSSYTEIAPWESTVAINDGEIPVASFVTQNFSYKLLGFAPLCTGLPWTEGDECVTDNFHVKFFADRATIDGNIESLKHALDVTGSRRIAQLRTSEDDSWAWSLFLIKRHEVRTQCMILKP